MHGVTPVQFFAGMAYCGNPLMILTRAHVMNYKYIAFNAKKEISSGIITADGEEEAERAIQNHNLKLISLSPVREKFNPLKIKLFEEPLSQKDVIYFFRQNFTLLSAGIPLLRSLSLIQEQTTSRSLSETLAKISTELRKGTSLSSAMEKQRKVFSAFATKLVEIGEKSGNLEEIMKQLVIYSEQESDTKKKILKSLTYPAIVVAMAIVVFIIMITVVMPQFLTLFQQLGTELPLPTKIMLRIAKLPDFLADLRLLPLWALILILVLYLSSKEGKNKLQIFVLKMPLLGKVILLQNLGRISRSLAIQLDSGINIADAFQTTEQMTGNTVLKKELSKVRKAIIEGETLRFAMEGSAVFPAFMKQMIQTGEETGRLEHNLIFMADAYDRETDERIQAMVSMIEPVITIVIGAIVAFMALAIITPTFKVMDAIK